MFDYCRSDFDKVLYENIEDERDSIIDNYGDERYELLLANCDTKDAENIEQLNEIIECYSSFSFIIPVNNFNDYVVDKVHSALGDFIRNKEAGIWPYTFIEIDVDSAVEAAKEAIVDAEIYLDDEDWFVVSE